MSPVLFVWHHPGHRCEAPPSEAEIIRRRVASARKWRRRRRFLRLKALIIPRRRPRPARGSGAVDPAIRPA